MSDLDGARGGQGAQGPTSVDRDLGAPKDVPKVALAPGVAEVLRRLEEHRERGTRHVVGGSIAVGGMGEVLRVSDQDLGRELAMKIPRRDHASPDSARRMNVLARFLEEAQVTGQLHHPSIVPVHELSLDADGHPYFTMPLVRGWDFGEIIGFVHAGEREWTLARALGIVLKVCEALAYAHARGVIHRDIKPANIRVGRFGETYLMDWGLARVLGHKDSRDLRVRGEDSARSTAVRTERSRLKSEEPDSPLVTMDGDVVGTPYYMSPEQARGDIELVGPRSDVYSLGALLYHLLAGRAPYAPAQGTLSQRAIWSLVLDGPPKPLGETAPQVPEELADICRKAMERDSARRYADARALALDIEAYLDRRPVQAHSPSVTYAMRLVFERNRKPILVAAAACALIVGVWGWQWSRTLDARAAERATQQLVNDGLLAFGLQSEVEDLYPAIPRMLPRIDRWLQAAGELEGRRSAFQRELQGGGVSEEKNAALIEHLSQLDRLQDSRASIDARRAIAAELEQLSLIAHAQRWREVSADTATAGAFGATGIAPQVGLVPLWKNRRGLWEFWHVNSGLRPVGESEATLDPRPEDGIVLVLLPGVTVEVGSPIDEPGRGVNAPETLHTAALAPYFIGKHEVTQAQWSRLMGGNPSRYRPENRVQGQFTLLNPVESVSWNEAREFCSRLDLRLPGESEWEHACRAESIQAYYWGSSFAGLEEHENILDLAAGPNAPLPPAPWDDGYPRHAPIARFAPNGFGLFDMLGNVSEWCQDEYYRDPVAGPSPEGDESPGMPLRAFRGGCWYFPTNSGDLEANRCAFRQRDLERGISPARGLRVARECTAQDR